mgnify:CR=1 FL=1
MTQKIYPVILSGGFGSRLWPVSREKLPKQFISTTEKQTFFNSTVDRFKSNNFNNITVIGNFEHRFLIYDVFLVSDGCIIIGFKLSPLEMLSLIE